MSIGRLAPSLGRVAGRAVVVGALVATAACQSSDDGTAAAERAAVGAGVDEAEPGAETGPVVGDDGAQPITTAPEPVRPEVDIPADWPTEIEAVYGRYWLYWEAFAAAHGPPSADPSFEPLRTLSTPANWASLQEQLQGFADDGLVLELPEPSVTEHLIRMPGTALLTGAEGEEVVLQDCWIDDFVQRTIDGAVVGTANEAKLMNVVMRVVDGEWRVDGVTRASSPSDGVEQCADLIN